MNYFCNTLPLGRQMPYCIQYTIIMTQLKQQPGYILEIPRAPLSISNTRLLASSETGKLTLFASRGTRELTVQSSTV